MSQDGYTLSEVLVALAILGLAIGGLTQAVHVIGASQAATATQLRSDQSHRQIAVTMQELVGAAGPFNSEEARSFTGGERSFWFACGSSKPCGAFLTAQPSGDVLTVVRPSGAPPRSFPVGRAKSGFRYQGALSASPVWPPGGDKPQALRAVTLNDLQSGEPIAESKLWIEQGPDCRFDAVANRCRGADL